MSHVERYYDEHAEQEWLRLERDRTEFALTIRALAEYLPPAPASVLDIGGGPGRYAIALAQRGYAVTLADLSQAELDVAAAKAVEAGVVLDACVRADVRDLSRFEDEVFDAVVLMGPLYHLLEEDDRLRAVREGLRVLRAGGVLFAAFISRYAAIRYWAKYDPMQVVNDLPRYESQIATGQTAQAVGFTDLYLAHPTEVQPFMERAGAETLDLIGVEGVISMIRDKVQELTGEAWERWMDLNYRLGRDPSTHGGAEHLLYVGRKASGSG
ncbi:MAG: class I SAM-dependent methyltransferase [Dehalococcoidia bacterium]